MKQLVVVFLLVVMSGCAGTPIKWDDARRIKPGMTTQEVSSFMGQPYSVKAQGEIVRYIWVEVNPLTMATKSLSVDFVGGRVAKAPPIPDEFK